MYEKDDVMFLSGRGRALIFTDLHGNLDNLSKIMAIWKECPDKKCHLIITGDFIHGVNMKCDESLAIIDEFQHQFKDKYFHLLLGNHEWATITGTDIYKGGLNQNQQFFRLLEEKYNYKAGDKLEEYVNFFKKLPIAVKTENGLFISHAGPSLSLGSFQEIRNLTALGYEDNRILYELLWNRYGDYDEKDVDSFLEKVGCKAMLVGHTPVDGIKLIGNQLVVSVSSTSGKRAYVDVSLQDDIYNGIDLKQRVRYFG